MLYVTLGDTQHGGYEYAPAIPEQTLPAPSYSSKQIRGEGDDTVFLSTKAEGLVTFAGAQIFPKEDRFKTNFQAFVYRMSDGQRVFTAVNCIGHCKSERTKYLPAGDYFIEVRGDDDGEWQLFVVALH